MVTKTLQPAISAPSGFLIVLASNIDRYTLGWYGLSMLMDPHVRRTSTAVSCGPRLEIGSHGEI